MLTTNQCARRPPGASEWTLLQPNADFSWKATALPILKQYVDSTDGSYISTKESALVWHYHDADPDFGAWQVRGLQLSVSFIGGGFHHARVALPRRRSDIWRVAGACGAAGLQLFIMFSPRQRGRRIWRRCVGFVGCGFSPRQRAPPASPGAFYRVHQSNHSLDCQAA